MVRVERRFTHPLLKKGRAAEQEAITPTMRPTLSKVGDMVRIQECAPISKKKRWTVIKTTQATADTAPMIGGHL